jgi:hypothetical protein
MRLQALFIVAAAGLALAGLIWATAVFFAPPVEYVPRLNRSKPIMCSKDQELLLGNKKVCIYSCENGEKSRVEGVEKCLAKIEL